MKPNIKKLISLLLIFVMLPCFILPTSAMAPSPPTELYGNTSTGIRFPTESGVIIEDQSVVFDLSDFPDYGDKETAGEYSGSVTTEYTLYNPTDKEMTLKLSYILDRVPSDYFEEVQDVEISKHSLMINGKDVQPAIRHCLFYSSYNENTNFHDLIHDEYINDGVCGPNMTVTKYTFRQSGVTEEHARLGFNIPENDIYGRCFYLGERSYTSNRLADTVGLRIYAGENGSTFDVYVFGRDLEEFPEWTVYTSYYDESETTDGRVELVGKETLSFSEYVFSYYDESLGISEVDFFNMAATEMSSYVISVSSNAPVEKLHNSFKNSATTGYVYEITIPAGERLVHTIVAPVYPSIETAMEPETYYYKYDLYTENAEMYTGNINIRINTPYYIIQNDYCVFEKTDGGYSMSITPIEKVDDYLTAIHGGFNFTLCESENPQKVTTDYSGLGILIIFVIIALAISTVVNSVIEAIKNIFSF